jgi:hypothetical protein
VGWASGSIVCFFPLFLFSFDYCERESGAGSIKNHLGGVIWWWCDAQFRRDV